MNAEQADVRVLLVDDQELFRTGVATILDAQPGISVVGQAADGRAAIAQVDDLLPDVVLMDIRMPELDGVSATREILRPDRVAARAAPVRVVVLTTFDLDDRAAEAIRLGATGFLLKDSSPAVLAGAIHMVHSGTAVLAPHDLSRLIAGTFRSRPPEPPGYAALTDKERGVFEAVARGSSNSEIGAELFMSESTVKTHVGTVLRKLGLRDRVQIAVLAHEHGLTGGRA